MSLDYTILGVLMEQPTHGYSIKKHLLETFSKKLGINDGQLYPALTKLERRGWIHKEVIQAPRVRHLYRITPDGEKAFLDWLTAADADQEDRYDFFWRYDLLQKCSFFRYLEADTIVAQLGRESERAAARIADLERVLERMEADRVDPFRRMIVEYGVRYQEMRRDWLAELAAHVSPQAAVAAEARTQ